MTSSENHPTDPQDLEILHLRKENQELRATVQQLQAEIAALREQLAEALRAAARQAAPFRRRQRLKVPDDKRKPPGRPPGHPGVCRSVPDHIDEHLVVPLNETVCPDCGAALESYRPVQQFIEDIPPVRPHVTEIVSYAAVCPRCGRELRSRHPLQTSKGELAAAVQLGPRALGLAASLSKEHGLTTRRVCAILRTLTGLKLSPGGLCQALARVAGRIRGEYEELVGRLRRSSAVFADETGWWVGGPKWWLWIFTTPDITLYRIDSFRGSQIVTDTLGLDFKGCLVSDCLNTYDPAPYIKHKCIAHHLRAISEAQECSGAVESQYLKDWRTLFISVIVLHESAGDVPPEQFSRMRQNLENRIDALLLTPRTNPAEEKVQRRLLKQRPHLLGCLYHLDAEPTNNRSERGLRPAVIARKLSCGNKTVAGSKTWETITSLAATCRQNSQNFVDYLSQKLSVLPIPSG